MRRGVAGLVAGSFPIRYHFSGVGYIAFGYKHSNIPGGGQFPDTALKIFTLNHRLDSRLLQLVHDEVSFNIAGCVVYGFHR